MRTNRTCLALAISVALTAGDWPQFHGPNASGVAADATKLPDQIGPQHNLLWKVPLPAGHSSPAVVGGTVFVTAAKDDQALTFAFEAATGKLKWQAAEKFQFTQKHHQTGNHAQPSPAADGECVVSFFGTCGLFCYDHAGKQLWRRPFGPFQNDFGAGASPVIVGNRVLLSQDHDTGSFLLVLDKKTGSNIWKADRAGEFPRNYATPIIWEVDGKKQVVVTGTLRAVGYDWETGKEVWTVRGLARIVNMTPLVGPDNVLYLPTWSPGGDPSDRIDVATFEELLAKHDKNGNGTFEEDEVPPGPLKERFSQIDRDKDGHITRAEFDFMRRVFLEAKNVCVAVKPGGTGDITATHVLWSQPKFLPYVPSPICVGGHLYLVKNGGLFTCLDAKTGAIKKSERVYGTGSYYASPVSGDGKIYLFSERGDVNVIAAGPDWKVLNHDKLGEDVFATPALANGRLFVRSAGHLWCFGIR